MGSWHEGIEKVRVKRDEFTKICSLILYRDKDGFSEALNDGCDPDTHFGETTPLFIAMKTGGLDEFFFEILRRTKTGSVTARKTCQLIAHDKDKDYSLTDKAMTAIFPYIKMDFRNDREIRGLLVKAKAYGTLAGTIPNSEYKLPHSCSGMETAISCGDVKSVKMLAPHIDLNKPFDNAYYLLHMAARSNAEESEQIVRILVDMSGQEASKLILEKLENKGFHVAAARLGKEIMLARDATHPTQSKKRRATA